MKKILFLVTLLSSAAFADSLKMSEMFEKGESVHEPVKYACNILVLSERLNYRDKEPVMSYTDIEAVSPHKAVAKAFVIFKSDRSQKAKDIWDGFGIDGFDIECHSN